uniref:Apple domain-containing protein n=1 Tax=Branchiostoma floridae TaxID=7739 RepID=C3ZK10_BRAFL|eukprot:XP_002591097.1 hypothetical protein BRAFLDRAFT_108708 [Branchiostoma floridae]
MAFGRTLLVVAALLTAGAMAGRALDLYSFTANRRLQGVANIIKCGMRPEDCAQWCMKEASFTCILTNNNDLILCNIEPEGCALRCLQETNFDCRSFDYGSSFRCCYLSAQDRTTQASSYQVTSGQDYYHYLPGNRWREDGRCGSSWAADLASPAECDPYGDYCCSGTRCQQGTCTSGTDYRGWDRCGERVCSCTSHSRTMTCSGRTVRELDFFIPRNTRNLDLSSNVLTSVPVSALAKLTELQTLSLRSNRIDSLPFDVFEDLASVQTINLQNNRFSELDLGQFMDLPSLRNLYMDAGTNLKSSCGYLLSIQRLLTCLYTSDRCRYVDAGTNLKFTWGYLPEVYPNHGVSCPFSNRYVDAGTNLKFTWGYLPEVYPNHGVSCPFNDCYSPCGDPHYLNGPQDWSRLQRDLVIKKLYFDLADLFYLVSDATQSVTIYAHTVVASIGVSFDFDLTIHTQMFWTGTNADLTFNLPSGHHHGPIITCGTLDDSFQQININVGDRLKINIVTNESFAMPYPCGDTRSTALSLQADSDQMAITVQCARLLAQVCLLFVVYCLLFIAMPYPGGNTCSTALSLQADSDQMAITVQCARLLAQVCLLFVVYCLLFIAMPYPCGDTRSTALSLQADSDQMAITAQCARLLAQDFNLADLRSQPMRMVDWVISQGRAAGDPVHSEAVTIKYELMVTSRGARYVPYLAQSVYFSMLDDYYREVSLFVCLYELMVTSRGARYVPYLAQSVYFSMLDDYYREVSLFVCLFVCLLVCTS